LRDAAPFTAGARPGAEAVVKLMLTRRPGRAGAKNRTGDAAK